MFLMPMLRTCPHFLRGRLRFSFFVGLRERLRAKMLNDRVGEARAWKLFGLIPLMLLHTPMHTGAVLRDELAQRADDLTTLLEGSGRIWSRLHVGTFQQTSCYPAPETTMYAEEWPLKAKCRGVRSPEPAMNSQEPQSLPELRPRCRSCKVGTHKKGRG